MQARLELDGDKSRKPCEVDVPGNVDSRSGADQLDGGPPYGRPPDG